MKQINLEEIIDKYPYICAFIGSAQGYQAVKKLMKEACFQILDLAVEEAEGYYYDESGEECDAHVSEFSISKIKDWIV